MGPSERPIERRIERAMTPLELDYELDADTIVDVFTGSLADLPALLEDETQRPDVLPS